MVDLNELPAGLPEPDDDGGASHLHGLPLPALTFPSTAGHPVEMNQLGPGRTVLFIYPLTGRPGTAQPPGWDDIPGARGCTTEACDFRDHHRELLSAGIARVFGLSSQHHDYQQEVVERLNLPYPLLSDVHLEMAQAMNLPMFRAGGMELFKRMTLVVADGCVEHVFYPVFPPNKHAQQVLGWVLNSG